MDQLPRLGKRELIRLLLFTCNYVVSVWRGFLFLWVLGIGYVILLWHSPSLTYNYIKPHPPPQTRILVLVRIPLASFSHYIFCTSRWILTKLANIQCWEKGKRFYFGDRDLQRVLDLILVRAVT